MTAVDTDDSLTIKTEVGCILLLSICASRVLLGKVNIGERGRCDSEDTIGWSGV